MSEELIRKLASRVLRAEVAARNARDVNATIDAISTRIRFDGEGDIYVVDRDGKRDEGKTFDAFLAEVERDRPELFNKTDISSNSGNVNPFKKGPGFSITNQMFLIRSNPDLAAQYEAEANTQ